MSPSAIQISGVSKSFGRKRVLHDFSIEIPPGCVFALLGENGAGKSTLIRGMLGYLRFNSGSVRILDLDPADKPLAVRRVVGYVSDAPSFYDWMKVRDVAWYASGFYPHGFLEYFEKLAQDFALPSTTRIRELSKGMKSKLALALAMAARPRVLILDEPTSGLDPIVRRSFLESMGEVAAAGGTVFISSHQLHEVERIADRVGFLHDGRLRYNSHDFEFRHTDNSVISGFGCIHGGQFLRIEITAAVPVDLHGSETLAIFPGIPKSSSCETASFQSPVLNITHSI